MGEDLQGSTVGILQVYLIHLDQRIDERNVNHRATDTKLPTINPLPALIRVLSPK